MSYGQATADFLDAIYARGVTHAVALMRHSAREYVEGRHDLENPLTPEGRTCATDLGARLPKHLTLRGYASPPGRCMETAELLLSGHQQEGGAVTRHRPIEALGVFYALDQIKMWKSMRDAGGLAPFLAAWFDGSVPADTMMDPDQACASILKVMAGKLRAPLAEAQLDVCVSHDMTLYLMGERLLGEAAADKEVAYLDALVLFEQDGALRLASHHGTEMAVSDLGH